MVIGGIVGELGESGVEIIGEVGGELEEIGGIDDECEDVGEDRV